MLDINRLFKVKPLLLIAISYSIVISILFFIPGNDLPRVKIKIYGLDKIIHAGIHFILINLWMLYFYVKKDFQLKAKWVFQLFLLIMLFGIIVEILQGQPIVSRGADIFDVAANLTGSLLGILFFKIVINNIKLKKFN